MEENCCNLASVVFWAVGPQVFCVLTAWKAEMNCQIIKQMTEDFTLVSLRLINLFFQCKEEIWPNQGPAKTGGTLKVVELLVIVKFFLLV